MWPMPLAGSRSPGSDGTPGPCSKALTQGQAEPAPAVGLGEEYRLSTPGMAGATVVA
jgi:hypothetical protein